MHRSLSVLFATSRYRNHSSLPCHNCIRKQVSKLQREPALDTRGTRDTHPRSTLLNTRKETSSMRFYLDGKRQRRAPTVHDDSSPGKLALAEAESTVTLAARVVSVQRQGEQNEHHEIFQRQRVPWRKCQINRQFLTQFKCHRASIPFRNILWQNITGT